MRNLEQKIKKAKMDQIQGIMATNNITWNELHDYLFNQKPNEETAHDQLQKHRRERYNARAARKRMKNAQKAKNQGKSKLRQKTT